MWQATSKSPPWLQPHSATTVALGSFADRSIIFPAIAPHYIQDGLPTIPKRGVNHALRSSLRAIQLILWNYGDRVESFIFRWPVFRRRFLGGAIYSVDWNVGHLIFLE